MLGCLVPSRLEAGTPSTKEQVDVFSHLLSVLRIASYHWNWVVAGATVAFAWSLMVSIWPPKPTYIHQTHVLSDAEITEGFRFRDPWGIVALSNSPGLKDGFSPNLMKTVTSYCSPGIWLKFDSTLEQKEGEINECVCLPLFIACFPQTTIMSQTNNNNKKSKS